MTNKPLAGRRSVITGASRGLGRGIAVALAKSGASVALVGRDLSQLEITESTVKQFGGESRCFVGDVADEAQVARLERVFSLYQQESAICRMNRDGRLADPPLELVRLLGESAQFSSLTAGAFDATVQPLWALYAAHFQRPGADPAGPPEAHVEQALRRVGYRAVDIGGGSVGFSRPGMAVTLNGIAQGFITDRIVELLRGEGIDRSLVDMGETRAIGGRPTGGPWVVGLEDPSHPGRVAERIAIENQAVATSGGYGTPIDPAGRFNHLFDPRTGATSWRYRAVSVVAPTATTADALSTAFSLMPLEETRAVVERLGVRAYFALPDGSRVTQGA